MNSDRKMILVLLAWLATLLRCSHSFLDHCLLLLIEAVIKFQDLAASIEKEDVANFTRVVHEYHTTTPLVYLCHFVSQDLSISKNIIT